jgi:hypothetical protein
MRKQSKYRPKAKSLPITIRFSKDAELRLCLVPQVELSKFREGLADAVSVNTLAMRLNFGDLLAAKYFVEGEARATMEKAVEALQSVKARADKTGKIGATGEEYHRMADGLNLTDQMQESCTRAELYKTLTFVLQAAGE